MLDVLTLAAFYTIRLVAGAVAVDVLLSKWLLGLSMFLFLSLAFVKRFSELKAIADKNKLNAHGRGYLVTDLNLISSMGVMSGYMAVLVLALYANSPESTALYKHPTLLWLLCPVLLYWISRTWLITNRGEMHDDPIVFALRDKFSWFTALFIGVIALMTL